MRFFFENRALSLFLCFFKKIFFEKSKFFKKKNFHRFFDFFRLELKNAKKVFFPLWGQVIWDLEFFSKKSKIETFLTFLSHFSSDRSDIAYLDRLDQYLQLFYWHHVRQVSQIFFISNFLSKISVFRHFFKFECLDWSHIAYLDRPYQYLQLLYWHHVRQVSQIKQFFIKFFSFSAFSQKI